MVVVGCCRLLCVVDSCWLVLVGVGCCWWLMVDDGCCLLLFVVVGCCWLLVGVRGCCGLVLVFGVFVVLVVVMVVLSWKAVLASLVRRLCEGRERCEWFIRGIIVLLVLVRSSSLLPVLVGLLLL